MIAKPLKGFLGDFVEYEHNEGHNDFTNSTVPVLLYCGIFSEVIVSFINFIATIGIQ